MYNPEFDRITTKNAMSLKETNASFYNVSTSFDPFIEKLALSGEGNVFATDAILGHLMASGRTVYPWDIVVTRIGEYTFFDKRENAVSI